MTVVKARKRKVPVTVVVVGATATWSSDVVWQSFIELGIKRMRDVRSGLPQTRTADVGTAAVHLGRNGIKVMIRSGPPLYPEVVPQQGLW